MTEQKSFEDLLVDEEEVNEALLTETVIDYVQIGQQSGDLTAKPAYDELTAAEKLTIVLLAHRARVGLGLADDEWLEASKVVSLSGLKDGTAYPALRRLADDNVVRTTDDGEYKIPAMNVEQARAYLEEES